MNGVQRQRDAHWPHSAKRCRVELDLDAIEDQAIRILARGMRTQRLVAFVGAGSSMAYGRMTWSGLMTALYRHVDQRNPKGWERINRKLWGGTETGFLSDIEHTLKSQVLSDMLNRLLPPKDLQRRTSDLLRDFHGFVDHVLALLAAESGDHGQLEAPGESRKARVDYADKARKKPRSGHGLAVVLQIIRGVSERLMLGADGLPPVAQQLLDALCHQSIGVDSPVRQLAVDWGIRRFITTNYDREIERCLETIAYSDKATAAEVQRNQFEVINFGPGNSGNAIAFALEGPRRHAQVLHLHGDVELPGSMIITESDYQNLYLNDHPLRDLVNNASLANFAANPTLFVGSDVNEDDVLRPMRQFMSGPGHRKDRMAVALFIATNSPERRARQQVKLLVRYGVHAIYAGRVDRFVGGSRSTGAQPNDVNGESWVHALHQIHTRFKEAMSADATMASALVDATAAVRGLGRPLEIEGVDLSLPDAKGLDFSADLDGLIAKLETLPATSLTRGSFEVNQALLLFDVTVNRIMGSFLCAKLISLRGRAIKTIRADTMLAWPYRYRIEPSATPKESIETCRWHGVSLARAGVSDRFAFKPAQAFDEGIADLIRAVQRHPGFAQAGLRRVIVACAARGAGKGAQSDRLMATHGTAPVTRPALDALLLGIGGYRTLAKPHQYDDKLPIVVHVNLTFLSEIGCIIDQVVDVLKKVTGPTQPPLEECSDQLEMLERGLRRFSMPGQTHRLLIVLGNAGVLFDAKGRPKNGQIRRVLRMLLSRHFLAAPLDVLMYVGESQIPSDLRKKDIADPDRGAPPAALEAPADRRPQRRLDRFRIDARPHESRRMQVYSLKHSLISDVASAYFAHVAEALEWSGAGPSKSSDEGALLRDLYFATGGSRFAQTLILALLDAADLSPEPSPTGGPLFEMARELLVRLSGPPSGSVVETTIEVVLDQWATWHQLGGKLRPGSIPSAKGKASPVHDAMDWLTRPVMTPTGWSLATELLWHLSAFSHPVETSVLQACPRVRQAAEHWKAASRREGDIEAIVIEAMLELLVHWCLLFRIDPRVLPVNPHSPPTRKAELTDWQDQRYRYTPHRHMQRHYLRLMGGRNVEATQWDQFTTTIYASMPDEVPSLRPSAHQTLTTVVKQLTHYPSGNAPSPELQADPLARAKQMAEEADRIRAAYHLVRSTYSLGVVSHLSPQGPSDIDDCGHMEQYRRLVRWITHAAQYWEQTFEVGESVNLRHDQAETSFRWSRPDKNPAAQWIPMGVFDASELIWLYNECGVISLAQGKLHDAEQLLSMAEISARRVEADDSGSLHTRIRIHTALVQIERGRPHRARQILGPIAERPNGHPVPPLLAESYLGLVEHIGGNYELASRHYKKALDGLRQEERSRAVAFTLMGQADLERRLRPGQIDTALAMADDAISLAEQGGHEDLRVMATLAHVRICVEARRTDRQGLFERLSLAQRYATHMDMPRIACDVHELRARLLLSQGEYHLSATDATASLEIAAMYDLKLKKARGLLTLGQIYAHRGELGGARSLAAMGREIAASCDYYACVRGFKDLDVSIGALSPLSGESAGLPH